MSTPTQILVTKTQSKLLAALELLEYSLSTVAPYERLHTYSPKEREPYDALCDRFVRSVELGLRLFLVYETFHFGERSTTLRDTLNRMAKLGIISSTELWMRIRDVRNRVVHDYLPEAIEALYGDILGSFAVELRALHHYVKNN